MRIGFDNEKYLQTQSARIRERIVLAALVLLLLLYLWLLFAADTGPELEIGHFEYSPLIP